MGTKNIIEVNGKQYDATTGAVLGVTSTPAHRGQNIDGFFKGRTTLSPTTKTPAAASIAILSPSHSMPKPAKTGRPLNHAKAHAPQATKTVAVRSAATVSASQKLTVHRTPATANHTKAHAAQHSQTLMRTAVKRPAPSFHKQVHTTGTLQHAVPSLIVPKKSALSLDEERLARAHSANRSPLVGRHLAPKSSVIPTFAPLAVTPAPVVTPGMAPAPQPHNKPEHPASPTDIFEHALANASHFVDIHAHKTHYKKKARQHAVSFAMGMVALLVIAGFATYLNTPSIQFKVASLQAGVSSPMPNLKAAGFAFNGTHGSDGKLTVGFSDAAGKYQLVQQTTNLSGNDMIQSVSSTDASGTPNYTTLQAGDTTIYRLSNNGATWVQNGQWYTVTGNKALSDQQLQSIAKNS